MHRRPPSAAHLDRAGTGEEGGLTAVAFVGSYSTADFRLSPALPEIAFVGRSNVGKSSLLNAFTGRRRLAYTSQTPGKTQTVNVYDVGGRYYLIDLPGYGYARHSQATRAQLHRLIGTYLSDRTTLAGVVWLLDVRRDLSADDRAVLLRLADRDVPTVVAVTKADKLARGRRLERHRAIMEYLGAPTAQVILTSTRDRLGVPELRDAVEELLTRTSR